MANTPTPKPASAGARRKPAARKPAVRKAAPKAAPKASTTPSALAWSLGGLALAAGAAFVAFLTRGRIAALVEGGSGAGSDGGSDGGSEGGSDGGHVPTDLLDPGYDADDRAIADFRPDMDAPMTAAEREALRPATGSAPTLVADRGDLRSQT